MFPFTVANVSVHRGQCSHSSWPMISFCVALLPFILANISVHIGQCLLSLWLMFPFTVAKVPVHCCQFFRLPWIMFPHSFCCRSSFPMNSFPLLPFIVANDLVSPSLYCRSSSPLISFRLAFVAVHRRH